MRVLLSIILLLSIAVKTTAQRRFGGTIHYLLVSKDSNLQVRIDAWFKKDKIKFITTLQKTPAGADFKNETIILDFKKGVIDRIKDDRKLVERERLTGPGSKQELPVLKGAGTATILGHPCTAFTSGRFSKQEKKDSSVLTTSGEIKIWYANDLFFPVADSLKMIQMVPLFTNGRLALGSDINIGQAGMKLALHTEAKEIRTVKRLKRSVFRYPKDYKLRYNE